MELNEIRINPENFQSFDLSSESHWSGSKAWKDALDIQTDIHRYLDEKLADFGSKDWAGRYATFLNKLGIAHQTDNGWWDEASVMPENLTAFIDFESDDNFSEYCEMAFEAFKDERVAKKSFKNAAEAVYYYSAICFVVAVCVFISVVT